MNAAAYEGEASIDAKPNEQLDAQFSSHYHPSRVHLLTHQIGLSSQDLLYDKPVAFTNRDTHTPKHQLIIFHGFDLIYIHQVRFMNPYKSMGR